MIEFQQLIKYKQMKTLSIFPILTFLFYSLTSAQMPIPPTVPRDVSKMATIDSGSVKVWYALNAVDINKQETYDDLQCLEIGNNLSKYYSYFVYNSDSLCTDWGNKHPHAQSVPGTLGVRGKKNKWSEYHYSEYFKSFKDNILTEYARMPRYIANRKCSQSIPVQNWSFQDDTLTVNGYLCQKAVCRFRGRNYIAWFAPDIPVSNGPWKFGGLPGLILKVYDTDKLYVFECVELKYFESKYPVRFYDYKDYTETECAKLLKLQKDINENVFKLLGLTSSGKFKEIPYYPLELDITE
jgi:GLPGLI family protein